MAPGAILLVDDTAANRVAMSALLESLDRPVIAVASGEEALRTLETHEVTLIILDVQMPGLDGYQTLVKIREQHRWSDVPVVFMTAIHDDREHAARGYALGAVDYVAKPFDSEVIVAKLRSLLAMHEQSEVLRHEAEELARERATRAERDRILGIVSHDLRDPLATIRTGADYLLSRELDATQAKVARRIQRNADRMARLINDLLDFSSLQHGALSIRPATSNLADIVAESVEDIQHRLSRPIELAIERVRAGWLDPDRIAQAVSNLVVNALEHSAVAARIAVGVRERENAFELSVWNEGELRAPDPSRIFEPFRRGEGSQGLGLGLYIAREIAKAHGGDVTVSSGPEQGTTFLLLLPSPVTEA